MRLVVIGNGMVGQRLLEQLQTSFPKLEITVLCEESRPAYDRVHLSSYFSGKSAQELSLAEPDFFDRSGIRLKLSERAVAIDRERRVVETASGLHLEYDRVVLATGSYPFVPSIPGCNRPGCYVYRTIDDLDAIRLASANAKSCVVIGGGLLGLEAAKALQDLGLETHVVEFAPRLMAVQIDDAGGSMLRGRIRNLGVGVHTAKQTTAIVDGSERTHRLQFADGSDLETDLIVFSAGIRPRDEWARVAGLQVGDRGGVVIDDACRTSDLDIFAIGECALWKGKVYGLVAPGYQMASIVASQLQGGAEVRFGGADMSTKLKLMGVDVASIGDSHAMESGARACVFIDERRQIYKKLVVNEEGTRLLGGILIGSAEEYGTWLQMVQNESPLPANPEQLMFSAADELNGHQSLGLGALPDSAQICSCNNVSKRDLCAAIAGGARTVGALKQCTKAASSCGGCAPLVTQVLKTELSRLGVAVNSHICEHFAFSRRELFDLAGVGGLHT